MTHTRRQRHFSSGEHVREEKIHNPPLPPFPFLSPPLSSPLLPNSPFLRPHPPRYLPSTLGRVESSPEFGLPIPDPNPVVMGSRVQIGFCSVGSRISKPLLTTLLQPFPLSPPFFFYSLHHCRTLGLLWVASRPLPPRGFPPSYSPLSIFLVGGISPFEAGQCVCVCEPGDDISERLRLYAIRRDIEERASSRTGARKETRDPRRERKGRVKGTCGNREWTEGREERGCRHGARGQKDTPER